MKKTLVLFFFIIWVPRLVWAQHYVALNDSNVFRNDSLYLIDIPLNTTGNLFILDHEKLIPINIYHEIWTNNHIPGDRFDEENNYFTFDTVFVTGNNKILWKNGLDADIIKKSLIPIFFGNYQSQQPDDTLKNADYRFKVYKQLSKDSLLKNEVLIYYVESQGSKCCPRDTYYDNKISMDDFIREFEKTNHVKVGEIYTVRRGDEGESSEFYSLSGLSGIQKLQFITERKRSLATGNSNEANISHIYIPRIYSINYLKEDSLRRSPGYTEVYGPDQIYGTVDVKPEFAGGEEAFSKLFDALRSNWVMGKMIITFVVKSDGSLSDIKVIRDGSEKINRQIKNVVNNSPKWTPGKLNGKYVNTYYTFTTIL